VQTDSENLRLANTVLAMITGNLADAGRPTTVLVDPTTSDGRGSGLAGSSLVKCYNLAAAQFPGCDFPKSVIIKRTAPRRLDGHGNGARKDG
jgi:hypothetical protein